MLNYQISRNNWLPMSVYAKRDTFSNIERYKARFVAKNFTEKEGIYFHETFSPVSRKDSFRIIID